MLILLACDGDAKPGDSVADRDTDTDTDSGVDSDSGPGRDTSDDTGIPPEPFRVAILAPDDSTRLFVDTRYDAIFQLQGVDNYNITITGADYSCTELVDDWVHCAFSRGSAGHVSLALAASGPGGEADMGESLTIDTPVGVVPRGDQFALGMYEVMDESWFAPVAGAGFNLAQSYGTGGYTQEDWQQWADDAGILTMTRTSWSWSDPWGEPSSDEVLAQLAGRDELAWWELPDNAVEDDSYADEVHALVERIRLYDDRPAYMYLWTSITTEQIEAYLDDLEAFSPGTYPEHACQPQPWIRWRIESAREAVANKGYTEAERAVIGTADLYGQAETSCPERQAELAQVRMNPLAMMAAGARGVTYFAWYYAVHSLDPAWGESALATAELISGESGLGYAVIHGEPRGNNAVTVLSGPTQSESFVPAQTTTAQQFDSIHAASWDYAGTRFTIAVNYTAEVIEAEIAGFPAVTPGVEVVGESRTLAPRDGVVTESFDGWGAHVYRAPIVEE